MRKDLERFCVEFWNGPFCAICHYGDIELKLYRGEWWCEECIIAEEVYEHDMAIRG